MNTEWAYRSSIVSNLFNPAFCGEILRRVARSYIENSGKNFPFPFAFIVLPILLHKESRDRLPKRTTTYLFAWVESNEDLFFNFYERAKSMVPFTKEALIFLLQHQSISFDVNGQIEVSHYQQKKFKGEEDENEIDEIMNKAIMLGKWLSITADVKSIYSFFRITP